jgi:hypothetical protein
LALQGTLDTFSLPDVLRLLATTAKTGRLRLDGDRGHGSIWLRDGSVVAAVADRALDTAPHEEVLFELLRFETGGFAFDSDEETDAAGKPEDVEGLLRRAGALLSEWNELEVVVPSLDHRVSLSDDLPSDEVTIDADRWRSVVAAASGGSVSQLGDSLGLSELGVSRVVRDLVDLGVADVSDPWPDPDARRRDGPAPRGSRRSESTGILGRRANRSRVEEEAAPHGPLPELPDPAPAADIQKAGWLQADTGSQPAVPAEPLGKAPPPNGAPFGGARSRSAAPDPAAAKGGLTSRLGPPKSSDDESQPPPTPEQPGSGLSSRLGRDRPARSSSVPPAPLPAPPATTPPAGPPPASSQPDERGTMRRRLPRRGSAAPGPQDAGPSGAGAPFDTGGFSPPLPSDTGQIRAVSSSALPADLHWAADDASGGSPTGSHPFSGLNSLGARRIGDGDPAPHVTAMSSEARAAVEATVGPGGGTQGRGPIPGDDVAQRGRLIDFLSSIRH